MALCTKEEGTVMAERPVSARQLSVSNIHTRQWFQAERGHCTPLRAPTPVLQRLPSHAAQMWAYRPWLW